VRPDLPVTRRYQQLLDDKSIDCIVAAVPDHWHRQMVIDAVSAGKDIYCEKPMSHTAADGVAMVGAAKKSGRIVQIGSQRVSSNITAKAREMIGQGMLGDLMLVEGWLGRNDPNGAWVYPPPPDLSPANVDWDTWQGDVRPKRPLDPEVFARWRCWKEYGTGVAGDLLVHLISGMLVMLDLNEAPRQAFAVGGIRHFKDGRNMPDVIATNYYYRDIPVYMRLNLATEMPETYRFQGSKGILEVHQGGLTFTPQTGQDSSPSYYAYSFPKALRDAYFARWHAENDARVAKEATTETITFRGHDYDDIEPHLANYFNAVRSRKPVVEDAVFGHHAALACHMANESYFRKNVVTWDEATQTIKG
jgi:predicted dehydrogenase